MEVTAAKRKRTPSLSIAGSASNGGRGLGTEQGDESEPVSIIVWGQDAPLSGPVFAGRFCCGGTRITNKGRLYANGMG